MPLHRATVNLPGLSFGQVADVPRADAKRWVEAGYLDPLTRDEAAAPDVVEAEAPSIVTPEADEQQHKGRR